MNPTIQEIASRHTVGIRRTVKQAEIGAVIGQVMPAIMEAAGEHMAGPVISRWHAWENDAGDMEVCVPVKEPLHPEGECEAGTLPGGRAVVADYIGSYEGLPGAWTEFKQWLVANGHASAEGQEGVAPWEEYHSDCSVTPEDELLTRIVWPIP